MSGAAQPVALGAGLGRSGGTSPMTIPAMRAAVIALRTGLFDQADETDYAVTNGFCAASVRGASPWSGGPHVPWSDLEVVGAPVAVLAGHAGAGASTTALALATALAEQAQVRLVEYAEPARSGLVAASTLELGMEDACWRRGRRGRLDVFRLARRPADGLLPPPPGTKHALGLMVVDAGWSLTAALLDSQVRFIAAQPALVATRVTVPAIRQTEHLLAAIDGDVVIAAVGPARWPRIVEASCGPRLKDLRSRGRVIPIPVDRRLAKTGLTGDPLPKKVAAAGRTLAALLLPAGSPGESRHPDSPRPRRSKEER